MSDELPEGWAEAPLSDLITELRNGISTRPSLEPPGTPILRISAARAGGVALNDRRYLPDGDKLLGTFGLRGSGPPVHARYNGSLEASLGVCGMVRGLGAEPLLYPDKLMRVRVRDDVSPEYVELFFRTPAARDEIMALAKSSAGQQGISGGDLKEQRVAVAPFDLHVDETWAWCEFASADDLARFEAAGLSPELHKVVVPPRPPHNEREFPAVMTAKDFREIVEVFRIP